MSIDAEQFAEWLASPGEDRCILVEFTLQGTPQYLSTVPFVSASTDTPASTRYNPIVEKGFKTTQSMALDGSVSISYGDIELTSGGGADNYLSQPFNNLLITVLIGAATWERADFRTIFSGSTIGIDSKGRNRVSIKVSDKLQRLNSVVSDVLENGGGGLTTPNAELLRPLCFGECHNVTPNLKSLSGGWIYRVHNGPIEGIIEVRDNGVPVSFTPMLSTGEFLLATAPAGTITASVQGHKPSTYMNNVVDLIIELATNFGPVSSRLTTSDFDMDAMNAFKVENMQPVGVYLREKANVLDVCNQLARSVGAQLVTTKAGLLRLVQLDLALPADVSVSASEMGVHSEAVASIPEVKPSVYLAYCKNWTPQSTVALGVVAQSADLFAQEWLHVTVSDTAAATTWKKSLTSAPEETLLLVGADAVAEATRRLNLFKESRRVVKYKAFSSKLFTELGEKQTLTGARYLTFGQVISTSTDWMRATIDIEVLG